MKGRKAKAVIAGLVVLCLVSMSLLGIIWHREGYTRKVLIKLGLTTEKDPTRDHNALLGWQASLESMNYKADVAFFGDSITKITAGRTISRGSRCAIWATAATRWRGCWSAPAWYGR